MSNRFSYVKYDYAAIATQNEFKAEFEKLEDMLSHFKASARLPPGRAIALALTSLEEAYMWVGKAIRDDQITRNGVVDEQPERTDG